MTSLNLLSSIKNDLKVAMRNKEQLKVTTLRMLLAAIKQIEIDKQISLSEDKEIQDVICKQIKQRTDSIKQYLQASRDDLVNKEQTELHILKSYLPAQLSKQELKELINQTIQDLDAKNMSDMGKVMQVIKPKVTAKADISEVSLLVKQLLK